MEEIVPFHLKAFKNVIFDVDGTLVDSNGAHAHAFIDAFEAEGVTHIDFNDICKLIGMSGQDILCRVLDAQTFEDKWQRIEATRLRIFEERYLSQVQPTPGVYELISWLKDQGLNIALSSASPKALLDPMLQKLGITQFIDGYTASEDTPAGKPNPLVVEACCEKFGYRPQETVLIGDSPYDVIAAHEYSVAMIGVLTGGYSEDELTKTGAMVTYQDLNQLLAALKEMSIV